jgi:hypothetical protein
VQSAIDLINSTLKSANLEPTSPASIVDEETHFELALHGSGAPKGTISGNFATVPLNVKLKYWELSNLRVELDVGFFGRGSEDVSVTWGLVHKSFDDRSNHPHQGDDAAGMLYSDSLFLTATEVPHPDPQSDPNEKRPDPVVQEHPGIPHWDKFTARLKLDVGWGFKYATIRAWHFYLTGIHLVAKPGTTGTPAAPAPVDHKPAAPKVPEQKSGNLEPKKKGATPKGRKTAREK